MDQYLKDSPGDYNNYEGSNNQYNNENEQDSGNYNYANTNATNNQFSLNLEQGYTNNVKDEFDNNQFPSIPGSEFLSPNIEAEYSGSYNNGSFNNEPFNNEPFNNEPFGDDLDSFNFPAHPQASTSPFSNTNVNPPNLDEIISPNNQANNQFLDSQYFSPPGKQSIDLNALSPQISASRGIPFQNTNNFDLNSGSYLSPQQNLLSPSSTNFENSLDTLRSPNFASYLNSPPQYNNPRNISANISSSIPDNYLSANNLNTNSVNLNDPGLMGNNQQKNNFSSLNDSSSQLGTSAPSSNMEGHGSSKQLSKEEKLKRRREFHNAVERRRRDLIKEKIKELGLLVPPSLLNPQLAAVHTFQNTAQLNNEDISDLLSTVKVKESKPNKSTILNKSVDYIIHLQYVMEEQDKTRKLLQRKLDSLNATNGFNNIGDSFENSFDNSNNNNMNNAPETTNNFMQDFQNQQTQDDNFDPDDFFSEIITGNEN